MSVDSWGVKAAIKRVVEDKRSEININKNIYYLLSFDCLLVKRVKCMRGVYIHRNEAARKYL